MKALYTACAAVVLSAFLSVSVASAQSHQPPQHPTPKPTHQVPEPATILLVGAALSALGIAKRVKK
ncbi:MAG: PEP-CTERM sorting domain-containing protein [Deltaproteobacteria bacterium]|nr:PEP-CTERM sorting domain-containing protein [Deltaproteobacteria bacterium]